jgi:hypothetical protein
VLWMPACLSSRERSRSREGRVGAGSEGVGVEGVQLELARRLDPNSIPERPFAASHLLLPPPLT